MELSDVRAATLEVLKSSDESDVDYIDEDLLRAYEAESRDAEGAQADEAFEPPEPEAGDATAEPPDAGEGVQPEVIVYGNHPVWVRRNDRPPYVGVFYWSNGSTGYPNDPCGRNNRWHRWLRTTPYGEQFRRCRGYTSFRFGIY
jgi:hypothetical protein